jgi:hypothetical protein
MVDGAFDRSCSVEGAVLVLVNKVMKTGSIIGSMKDGAPM